jgi:hypothetical protein
LAVHSIPRQTDSRLKHPRLVCACLLCAYERTERVPRAPSTTTTMMMMMRRGWQLCARSHVSAFCLELSGHTGMMPLDAYGLRTNQNLHHY